MIYTGSAQPTALRLNFNGNYVSTLDGHPDFLQLDSDPSKAVLFAAPVNGQLFTADQSWVVQMDKANVRPAATPPKPTDIS